MKNSKTSQHQHQQREPTLTYDHAASRLVKIQLLNSRAISIKGLYAKMAKLSYIRQINRGNELLLLKESKVRLKVILSG